MILFLLNQAANSYGPHIRPNTVSTSRADGTHHIHEKIALEAQSNFFFTMFRFRTGRLP